MEPPSVWLAGQRAGTRGVPWRNPIRREMRTGYCPSGYEKSSDFGGPEPDLARHYPRCHSGRRCCSGDVLDFVACLVASYMRPRRLKLEPLPSVRVGVRPPVCMADARWRDDPLPVLSRTDRGRDRWRNRLRCGPVRGGEATVEETPCCGQITNELPSRKLAE